MRISFKLIIIMVAMNLFSIGAVGITLLLRAQNNISGLAYNVVDMSGEASASKISAYLETFWYSAENASLTIGQYEQIMTYNRRPYLNTLLKAMVAANDDILGIWCIFEPDVLEGDDQSYLGTEGTNETGRYAAYWYQSGTGFGLDVLDEGTLRRSDDPYRITMEVGVTTLLEPYIYTMNGTDVLMTTVAVPIRKNNRIVGAVGIDIDMQVIQEISQTNKPFGNAMTAVFSNTGVIAGSFDPSRLGKNIRESERDMMGMYMEDILNAIRMGQEYTWRSFIAAANADMHLFIVPINVVNSTTPWSFAVGITQTTVLAPVFDMMTITLVISIGMLLVVVLGAIFFSRSISKPIIHVAATLKDISEGEGDLTRSIPVKGNDEIADLSRYFNATLEKIKNLVRSIKQKSIVLFDIGTELASNMTETAASVNEITATIESIKTRAINQSASVTETNATMEQITVNIDRLSDHVDQQTDSVARSSAAIEEMLVNIQSVTDTLIKNAANVKELTEASDVGRTGLQDVASDIQEIARESEGLLEINTVMENIASQTNLLSMNAAIEAAHAGEAGKGFAVVADEIRKLAENSGEQSKTISSVLKKIKTSIDKITHSTNNVLDKFEAIDGGVKTVAAQEENIRNAMEEQSQGSKQILQTIERVNEITQQVKGGSMEMLEGSREVIQESKNLEIATQEITGGMNEMAVGAEQINVAVLRVNELSGANRENIDLLVQEVSRFKVE